jgi:hypothetical protein
MRTEQTATPVGTKPLNCSAKYIAERHLNGLFYLRDTDLIVHLRSNFVSFRAVQQSAKVPCGTGQC